LTPSKELKILIFYALIYSSCPSIAEPFDETTFLGILYFFSYICLSFISRTSSLLFRLISSNLSPFDYW